MFVCGWNLPYLEVNGIKQHKGGNQDQVHETKTFENLKYEPILGT